MWELVIYAPLRRQETPGHSVSGTPLWDKENNGPKNGRCRMRGDALTSGLTLAVDEVSVTGNRAPSSKAQYRLANDGIVNSAPGQSVAQLVLSAGTEPVGEADIRVRLVVRDAYSGDEVGRIDLTLKDGFHALLTEKSELPR